MLQSYLEEVEINVWRYLEMSDDYYGVFSLVRTFMKPRVAIIRHFPSTYLQYSLFVFWRKER